jgi:2-phospho-L-lactate guanylyltransferase
MNAVENLAILVPLKGFTVGKSRLRDAGVSGVDEMARSLAHRVLIASRPRPVYVACESADVAEFARTHGAGVIESAARDLNEAVAHSYRILSLDFERLVIVHGDLRQPAGLGQFNPSPGVTVVTDSHGTGTNVLALPTGLDFIFRYGPRSAQAHEREARRLRIPTSVTTDSPWRFDVDYAHDIED